MPPDERPANPDAHEATILIRRAAAGDADAARELLPVVYARLRALAGVYVRGRPEHTLQATALAHEAYLKLMAASEAPKDREHFLAVAATAMRQILADHARRRTALKRGGGRERIPLDAAAPKDDDADDLVALHLALERLGRADPRRYRVVELRFLGGLSVEETARILDVSERTVESDWRAARLWLQGALGGEE
ncbi:MAG: ECF-type sigma factor [Phycisphaerales bacterium]